MAGQKFPEVGLRAVFEITGFQKNYSHYQSAMRDIDKITKQTAQRVNQSGQKMGTGVAQSFEDLIDKSKILGDAFSSGAFSTEAFNFLNDAFANLGQNAGVNVEKFDQLIQSGSTLGESFQQATVSTSGLSNQVTLLGRNFSVMAVATGAAIAVLKVGINVIRESVEAYEELAEATRRVSLQTGMLTQEASSWVQVAQSAGISAATSERAMTSFLGKIADMRREQLLGEESTSDFARAMETLGISVTDNQGNLRSTEALLSDVNRAFRQLGPGVVSAQLATDLFGYSGRFLLPVLVDQEKSLADLGAQAQELGSTLTSLDRESYEQLRNANIKLQQAFQGIKNEIARGWIPAITAAKNALADFINFFRQIDARMRAFSATVDAVSKGQVNLADATKYYADQLDYFLGIENEATQAIEAQAQAQANAAQDIVASEAAIREAREKTLQQLDELKAQLNQKLEDIDRDAQQQWEDILVNRQREAMDRALQVAWRLEDLRAAYNDRLADIERDFAKRWDDILVKRQRDALERAMRLAWQYEDLLRATEQRRADVLRDYAEREAEVRQETQKRINDIEREARERREDLEREHQRRLRDIQQDFLDTAQEAARRNDAVAVARAMRERARALRDEEQRHADEQEDLEESLQRKREEIQRDRQEREREERDELQRALRRIEENYQRQLEELARQQERERVLRELQYGWEREDFEKAKAEQLQAAQEQYNKQLEELEKAQQREEILRRIQYQRQEEDFRRNWQRRISEARRWYQIERDDLATQLNWTAQALEQAYANWMQQAATAASTAASVIAAAWASEVIRYQQYLSSSARSSIPHGLGTISMAEGGVIEASSPTTVVMGDAGPETGIFLPGRASSLSVSHSFGRLGVDFEGLPGGMNTQQVQAIVYGVMTQLAKGIQIPR